MVESKYSASFTAAALLYREHLQIKEMLVAPNFEERIDREVENNAYLGIKTRSARKRTVQEIKKRYAAAPEGFWAFFFDCNEAEQKSALFFLCLKAYPLMMDYHIEVALKKWRARSFLLEVLDLQMRLDEIASFDSNVDGWSESTKRKTMTVYMRTLQEAGLMKEGALIRPTKIGPDFRQYFIQCGEAWFIEACFSSPNQI